MTLISITSASTVPRTLTNGDSLFIGPIGSLAVEGTAVTGAGVNFLSINGAALRHRQRHQLRREFVHAG